MTIKWESTSIAIRNLENAQTQSFSIFQYAEIHKINPDQIHEKYDEIEKLMLNDFFGHLHMNSMDTFIHWNMRDINYGFPALEHRGNVLGCTVFKLSKEKMIDLSRILERRYSEHYADDPKFYGLVEMNKFNSLMMLTGKEEADAFDKREYVKLHQSTLRKVNIFESILGRIEDKTLVTKSSFKDVYGLSFSSIVLTIKEHPIYAFLGILLLIVRLLTYLKD